MSTIIGIILVTLLLGYLYLSHSGRREAPPDVPKKSTLFMQHIGSLNEPVTFSAHHLGRKSRKAKILKSLLM